MMICIIKYVLYLPKSKFAIVLIKANSTVKVNSCMTYN